MQGDFQSELSLDRPIAFEQMVTQVTDWIRRGVLVPGDLVDGFARWLGSAKELAAHFTLRAEAFHSLSRGVVGGSLDALGLIVDPVGALLQYGVAWLIEHVKPLSQALDWLAGDPAQIAAHAQTWRNVASSLREDVADLAAAQRNDLTDWTGAAARAYQAWATQQRDAITGLAKAAQTMATITEGAGFLIATVRVMVRDAIATVVSRLIVYAVTGPVDPSRVRQASRPRFAIRICRTLATPRSTQRKSPTTR